MQLLKRTLVVLVVLGMALLMREARLHAFVEHRRAQRYQDVYYLPSPAWLPVLSLGYQAALADLIWCRSLVYFGEELTHHGAVQYVFQYTDAILTLDPSFRAAYRWVATAAIYRPTEVDMATSLHAASYLKRAVKRWPNDGELRWDYGSLLRFELAPLEKDKARKQALLVRAAPELEMAARLGAGPPWLALNNVDLMNKLGRNEQAIRHLEELAAVVKDAGVKAEIAERLSVLRMRSYAESVRSADEQFEGERQQSYPYLSPGLFLLVGRRPDHDEHARFLRSWFLDSASLQELKDEQPAAN